MDRRVRCALELINSEDPFHVRRCAQKLGISVRTLERVFKQEIGLSPKEYELSHRLAQGELLLLKTSLQVSEIAFETGFRTANNFSRQFKKRYGVTPTEFRKHSSKKDINQDDNVAFGRRMSH